MVIGLEVFVTCHVRRVYNVRLVYIYMRAYIIQVHIIIQVYRYNIGSTTRCVYGRKFKRYIARIYIYIHVYTVRDEFKIRKLCKTTRPMSRVMRACAQNVYGGRQFIDFVKSKYSKNVKCLKHYYILQCAYTRLSSYLRYNNKYTIVYRCSFLLLFFFFITSSTVLSPRGNGKGKRTNPLQRQTRPKTYQHQIGRCHIIIYGRTDGMCTYCFLYVRRYNMYNNTGGILLYY